MRKLLAKLVNGEISRRGFTARMLGMGFGMMTVESILDTVTLTDDKKRAGGKKSETFRAEPFSEKTPYEQWMHGEGVPVHTGYFVSDVRAAVLKPWNRLGAKGALIDQGAFGAKAIPGFQFRRAYVGNEVSGMDGDTFAVHPLFVRSLLAEGFCAKGFRLLSAGSLLIICERNSIQNRLNRHHPKSHSQHAGGEAPARDFPVYQLCQ